MNSFGRESENTWIIFGCVLGKLWVSASLDVMSVEHEKSGSICDLRFRRVVGTAFALIRVNVRKGLIASKVYTIDEDSVGSHAGS